MNCTTEKPVVTGDQVRLTARGETMIVSEVLPRRTFLSRPDPHDKSRTLAIVANVDVIVVVVSAKTPALHPRIIDRYLIAIRQGGAEAMVVLNKADLSEDLAADLPRLDPYREMGVPVCAVSTETGLGIAELKQALAGKTCAFVGHSGVGKSSLLNAILPEAAARVSEVSDRWKKGRHTTTASALYESDAIRIVDTPGVRQFALDFESPEEVAEAFEEFAHAGPCRFANCLHTEEPGCAVTEAVRLGTIPRVRYDSYRRILAPWAPTLQESSMTTEIGMFVCRNCGEMVPYEGGGTEHRNHCPRCLHSMHLDEKPGDRSAFCSGVMEPVAVWVRHNGEWAIIHRCRRCGRFSSNRIASDDNEALLISLAVQPISRPAFPLDRVSAQ